MTLFIEYFSISLAVNKGRASHKMKALPRTFIQFACDSDHSACDDLFIKHLIKNIGKQNTDIREVFQCISDKVYLESGEQQRPVSIHDLSGFGPLYLNQVDTCMY